MKVKATLLILYTIMLASCTPQEAMLSDQEQAQRDSLALHIAVLPVMDCLPLYYASRTGMLDSAGIDVRLHHYTSLMDIDTALSRRHDEAAYTDLIHLNTLQTSGTPLRAIAQTQGEMALLTAQEKRIRTLKQLRERTLAISRHSASDYWCDWVVDTSTVSPDDIYRPQIHDVQLRSQMLCDQLLDAALLPQPYASAAQLMGHRRLTSTPQRSPHLMALVATAQACNDTLRAHQLRTLLQTYDLAVQRIAQGQKEDTIRAILHDTYLLDWDMLDTIKLTPPTPLVPPKTQDIQAAQQWMQGRGLLPHPLHPDSLIRRDFTALTTHSARSHTQHGQ